MAVGNALLPPLLLLLLLLDVEDDEVELLLVVLEDVDEELPVGLPGAATTKVTFRLQRGLGEVVLSCTGLLPFTAAYNPAWHSLAQG